MFNRNRQEVAIGKERRIAFDKLHGLLLTNDGINRDYSIVRVTLLENNEEDSVGDRICHIVYTQRTFAQSLLRILRLILSYVLPRSTNISEHLLHVDWENLRLTQGYNAFIPINGKLDKTTIPPTFHS